MYDHEDTHLDAFTAWLYCGRFDEACSTLGEDAVLSLASYPPSGLGAAEEKRLIACAPSILFSFIHLPIWVLSTLNTFVYDAVASGAW